MAAGVGRWLGATTFTLDARFFSAFNRRRLRAAAVSVSPDAGVLGVAVSRPEGCAALVLPGAETRFAFVAHGLVAFTPDNWSHNVRVRHDGRRCRRYTR